MHPGNIGLFEPVHGSAPDIAGKGVANPLAAFSTAALLLDHLGEKDAALTIEAAIEETLQNPAARTRDLGGQASTADCTKALLSRVE